MNIIGCLNQRICLKLSWAIIRQRTESGGWCGVKTCVKNNQPSHESFVSGWWTERSCKGSYNLLQMFFRPLQSLSIFIVWHCLPVSRSLPLNLAVVSHPLWVSDKTALQILQQLFPDVKRQIQFPLLQLSVSSDKSGAAAGRRHVFSPLFPCFRRRESFSSFRPFGLV